MVNFATVSHDFHLSSRYIILVDNEAYVGTQADVIKVIDDESQVTMWNLSHFDTNVHSKDNFYVPMVVLALVAHHLIPSLLIMKEEMVAKFSGGSYTYTMDKRLTFYQNYVAGVYTLLLSSRHLLNHYFV